MSEANIEEPRPRSTPSTAPAAATIPIMNRLTRSLSERLVWGSVGGVIAGLPFIVLTMLYATRHGGAGVAPLVGISTVFNTEATPHPTPANIAIGLVTHLNLSILFGIGFALLLPLLRDVRMLVLAAVVYGLVLYGINFQVLGRFIFKAFTHGPVQWFEVVIHVVFALLLIPFFYGIWRRDIGVSS